MEEWRYNTTHILRLYNYTDVAKHHVVAALTYAKISLSPKDRRLGWPHTGSWRCAVKDFCPCRESNLHSPVNKTDYKINIFKNDSRLNSMQHKTSSKPAMNSGIQSNRGSSRNQKAPDSKQPPTSAYPEPSLSRSKPPDTIFRRSNLILFFNLSLDLSSGFLPTGFPSKTFYVFLFSSSIPHAFPLSSPFI